MLPVTRVVLFTALLVLLSCNARGATVAFPYLDRPRTDYSFQVTGTYSGSVLPPGALKGQSDGAGGGRTLATRARVRTGAPRPNGSFELTLTGESTWRSPGPSSGGDVTTVALDYRFLLDREGRIVSTNASSATPGQKFSAWHFLSENLATALPTPSPRRVSPGQSWVERHSSTQKVEGLSVETASKTSYRFVKVEEFGGRAAAKLTETTEVTITASRVSGPPLYKTRFSSSGQLWLEPGTGLLRHAEWIIDAQPEGGRASRALTLTYTLLSYSKT